MCFHKINPAGYIPLVVFATMIACKKAPDLIHTPPLETDRFNYSVPHYFPDLVYPSDNAPTKKKFLLGKKLFYDKLLSRDFSTSCASCHLQHAAFSDTASFSKGAGGIMGERNSPTLTNIGYAANLFWDGGVPTLELQTLAPLDNHNEFDLPYDSLIQRLTQSAFYKNSFQEVFGQAPNLLAYSKALACFERGFISSNSKYDIFYYKKDSAAFNSSELNGYKLFIRQETGCTHCHTGFNFTSNGFENNGLYKNYADPGRYKVTGYIKDLAKFKIPTLRNIALTAPYMHDGSIATLLEVVEHYAKGGAGHVNQSDHIKPLSLSKQDKEDIVNFLHTLTDNTFLQNQELRP